MRIEHIVVAVGLGATSVAMGQDRPQLQAVELGRHVEPIRVASVRYENGLVRFVEPWRPYESANRQARCIVFDAYEDKNLDGIPDGGLACGLGGEDSRWFFGSAFCNMYVTGDYTLEAGTDLDAGFNSVDFAWYWTCRGFGTENCIVAVFTQDSVPCDPNSSDYDGVLMDFGPLDCNGGYYFASIDGEWPMSASGTGSHSITFAKEVTSDGAFVLATCAQPMLWGTDPSRPGTQTTEQFDDVNEDRIHDPFSECFTYSFGLCPDPLAAMVRWWGEGDCTDCAYGDYNGDGDISILDFLGFLDDWANQDSASDCNGDGDINSMDVNCYLNEWVSCS